MYYSKKDKRLPPIGNSLTIRESTRVMVFKIRVLHLPPLPLSRRARGVNAYKKKHLWAQVIESRSKKRNALNQKKIKVDAFSQQ